VTVVPESRRATQDEEPAKVRRDSDRRDDANWSRHGRIVSLLDHLRAHIKLGNPEDQLEGGHPSAMHAASDLVSVY
jgi:hypothetical protein